MGNRGKTNKSDWRFQKAGVDGYKSSGDVLLRDMEFQANKLNNAIEYLKQTRKDLFLDKFVAISFIIDPYNLTDEGYPTVTVLLEKQTTTDETLTTTVDIPGAALYAKSAITFIKYHETHMKQEERRKQKQEEDEKQLRLFEAQEAEDELNRQQLKLSEIDRLIDMSKEINAAVNALDPEMRKELTARWRLIQQQ